MVTLLGEAAFKRFLFRVVIAADMLGSASGSEDRHLRHAEGRRSLGLDIFRWADDALSLNHPSGSPISTLAEVLRNEAQTPGDTNAGTQPDHDLDEDDDELRRV